jgi:hypothetical protein
MKIYLRIDPLKTRTEVEHLLSRAFGELFQLMRRRLHRILCEMLQFELSGNPDNARLTADIVSRVGTVQLVSQLIITSFTLFSASRVSSPHALKPCPLASLYSNHRRHSILISSLLYLAFRRSVSYSSRQKNSFFPPLLHSIFPLYRYSDSGSEKCFPHTTPKR